MGRPPGPVFFLSNVSPAVSAVSARGCAARRSRGLAQALHDEGYLDLQDTFIDGASHQRSREAPAWVRRKRGKGSKIMAIADHRGLPVAVHIESATPHEVTLVHATLAQRFVKPFPGRLIGDNAYESGPPGCRPGPPRRGTDRPAPQNTNIANPRRSPAASRSTEVEGRATLRLVPEFSAARYPLRALRRELSCDATPRLLPHYLARFMRWLLIKIAAERSGPL